MRSYSILLALALAISLSMALAAPSPEFFKKSLKVQQLPRRASGSQERVVFVSLTPGSAATMQDAEELARAWTQQLGSDNRVTVHAASTRKLVVTIAPGGPDDHIVSALRSFMEASYLEDRPVFRPLGNPEGSQQATM